MCRLMKGTRAQSWWRDLITRSEVRANIISHEINQLEKEANVNSPGASVLPANIHEADLIIGYPFDPNQSTRQMALK